MLQNWGMTLSCLLIYKEKHMISRYQKAAILWDEMEQHGPNDEAVTLRDATACCPEIGYYTDQFGTHWIYEGIEAYRCLTIDDLLDIDGGALERRIL